LLDLFCCAGGAGMGYHRAGFDVIGVDIAPQPHYPFRFIQRDVLTLTPTEIAGLGVAAIHASPICQGLTRMNAPGKKAHQNLIPATIALLQATGLPWVLENVEGAEAWMPGAITLCGSMFAGLESEDAWLRRHRLFCSNVTIAPPGPCQHDAARPVGGCYGGHARRRSRQFGGRSTRDAWRAGHRVAMAELLGIDWATCGEMSEAIPPAYTEHLGRQLLAHIGPGQVSA